MKPHLSGIFIFELFACSQPEKLSGRTKVSFQNYTEEQEKIIEEFSTQCANRHLYTFEMKEWQECLDKGLE